MDRGRAAAPEQLRPRDAEAPGSEGLELRARAVAAAEPPGEGPRSLRPLLCRAGADPEAGDPLRHGEMLAGSVSHTRPWDGRGARGFGPRRAEKELKRSILDDRSRAMAMISVLMPCRNGMPFLPWALQDLFDSSVPLEVLVCDDGSSDGSLEYLQALAAAEPWPTAAVPPTAPAGRHVRQEPWPGEDAPPPGPEALAARLRAANHRLRLLTSGGQGQGAAQNACLEAASCKLIGASGRYGSKVIEASKHG